MVTVEKIRPRARGLFTPRWIASCSYPKCDWTPLPFWSKTLADIDAQAHEVNDHLWERV